MPKAKQRYTVLLIILACILTGSTIALWSFIRMMQQEREKMTNLPEPPPGYKWAAVPELSDEFDGEYLSQAAWTPGRRIRSTFTAFGGKMTHYLVLPQWGKSGRYHNRGSVP